MARTHTHTHPSPPSSPASITSPTSSTSPPPPTVPTSPTDQWASLSASLAQASRRRDEEVRRAVGRKGGVMGRGEEEELGGREEEKGGSGGSVGGASVGGVSTSGASASNASAKGVGGRFDGGDEGVGDARDVGGKKEEEDEEAVEDAAGEAAGEGSSEINDKGKGKGKARCTGEETRDVKGKGKGKARRTEEEVLREKQAMIAQCMAEMQVASEELRRSDEELRRANEELRRADEEIARLDAEMEDEEAREEEEWRRIAERDTRKRVKLAGRCEHVRSFGESSRGAGTHEPAVRVAVSDTTGGSSPDSLFTFLNATDVDQDTPSLRGGNASSPDDDPAALLDELRSLVRTEHAPEAQNDDAGPNTDDIRQMLAELDQAPSSVHTSPAADTDTNPRQMLAELARLSNPVSRRASSPTDQDNEEDDEIILLQARLQNLRSPSNETPPPAPASNTVTTPLDPKALPYLIALQLESANCAWEHAQAWTSLLFSNKATTQQETTQQDLARAFAHAETRLQAIIASVTLEHHADRRAAHQKVLQRRLVVSNLAAAAGREDIEGLFWVYRSDFLEITFLPERDPLKRTQTVHIDMRSREAAVRASYVGGHVFGLIFRVELAVAVCE